MAKGIKKFDQEIRILGSWISIENSASTKIADSGYGAYYVSNNTPWFASDSATWELASANSVTANTALINSAIASGITFSDDNGNSGVVGLGDTLKLSAGTDMTVVYDASTSAYTITNVAAASTNYYLSATTISNGEITFDMAGGYSDHTLDLKEKLTLDQLSGVSTTGAADGDFLIYDITSGEWKASGITDDTLIAGDGINFTTGSGTVTINNNLMSAGTWIASDGTNNHTVMWDETIQFSGGTDISVTYDAATSAFTFANTYTNTYSYGWEYNGNDIASGHTVDITGTASEIVITDTVLNGNVSSVLSLDSSFTTKVDNAFTGVTFDSTSAVEELTFYTNDGSTVTQELHDIWVRKDGDEMTGALTIGSVGTPITNALKVYGETTMTGDVTITGDLYVSGTTTTIDVENLLVSDNIITVNAGEPTNAVSKGSAGIVVDRGTSNAYTIVYVEGTGVSAQTFRIGETTTDASATTIDSSLTQAVATRQDGITANSFLFWNDSESRIDGISAAPSTNQIALYNGSDWTYTDLTSAAGIYSWNTISGDTGSITTSSVNDSFTIFGGSGLTSVAGSASITINHDVVALTAPVSAYADNEFIDTFTIDTTGHITTITTATRDYLSASTFYYATMSADTGSVAANSVAATFTIVGGSGITTSIVGGNLVIDSDSSELVYTETIAASTTLTDSNTTGKNVAIVDYFSSAGQEGQIRILIASGDFTHDFQSGASDMTIDTVTISSNKIVLAQSGGSGTLSYTVKYI